MTQRKTFPPTTEFPLKVTALEREELENHYLNLRENYKRLKISRGLLLHHAGTKALLIERNQILEKAKRELELQIESIETSEASSSKANYQILQQVVDVFDQMEDLGNQLVIGYEDYDKGRRAFQGGAPLSVLIKAVINFFSSWRLIKEQITGIKDQIKALVSNEETSNKQLK